MTHHNTSASILTIALSVPAMVSAQDTTWLDSLWSGAMAFFSFLTMTLTAVALLVFIWGLVVFIVKSGDEKAHEEGRRKMVWGVVSLFVIVSVWGLVVLLQNITGISPATVVAPRTL